MGVVKFNTGKIVENCFENIFLNYSKGIKRICSKYY